jgi:hypothetical protein
MFVLRQKDLFVSKASNKALDVFVEDWLKYIIYWLYVFYCGVSKTLNPSLQVEKIKQTLRIKNAQEINQSCSNRLRVQIIPQLYSFFKGTNCFEISVGSLAIKKKEYDGKLIG